MFQNQIYLQRSMDDGLLEGLDKTLQKPPIYCKINYLIPLL